MILKYSKTILDAQDYPNRICGISWSPNQQRLAVATSDRTIILFDENGEKRDKFSTKPIDQANGKESYVIREIAFSPDSTRLAVSQSDNIVYVYKFGGNWNDKKVICNKFPQPSSLITIIWLSSGPIIAGLEDGKVRALNTKTNKSQNLYEMQSSVVSLAPNERGNGFICGHEDGTITRYYINEDSSQVSGRLIQHQTCPVALAWANGFIVAAGCDRKVTIYDSQGRQSREFDYANDEDEREFTVATCSPNGQTIAIGSYDKVRIFIWSPRQNGWTELTAKRIDKFYSITAMCWRRDGSRLVVGSLCGAAIILESVLKRAFVQDKFELLFVAASQVLLKSLEDRNNKTSNSENTIMITSQSNHEIYDVRIMGKNNYLVARTDESLILCDLTRNLMSEVSWMQSGNNEKFYFENPNVCLIFNAGELSLVEYGDNFILQSVRTEFANPHTISVRLNERRSATNNKKLAYLLDMKTICVVDLIKDITMIQINHNAKIDWLELNETGQKLLFRDKQTKLFLVDVITGSKRILLMKAMFVQWVIQSDVAIAQTDENLAIWYNIDMPEHITLIRVRGEVYDVIRANGKSTVKSREGAAEFSYNLDEGLVEFGTAVNDNDFKRAMLFLETLDNKPAAKAMWHNLANIAINQQNLYVAHRCFAALGNASKTFYLNECIKMADKSEESGGLGYDSPEVRAKLALLNSDLKAAETIYLEKGDIEQALEMYKSIQKWDDAIQLASRHGYSGVDELMKDQMSHLMHSGQEEMAGQVLESRGEIDQAMTLYLKAKEPIKAARLILKSPQLLHDAELLNRVISLLVESDLYELAGDLSQKVQQPSSAIDYYRKGQKFERAIELARRVSPEEVTILEEEYGDWLVSRGQVDASINRYIEAGATNKALEASVNAKQWQKGLQIARVLDEPDPIKPFASKLSEHLALIGNISAAEEIFIRAEMYKEAVDLLSKHGQWDKAHLIAEKYLGKDIVQEMFTEMAAKLEDEGKLMDAEKVLLTIGETDLAISMYKKLEQYDSMIRVVERFHPDLVNSTHLHLARQLEAKGKYKSAESHFIAAGDWKAAVHMYGSINLWEEAFRIAKQNGTDGAFKQVAYMWARTLPTDGAFKLLSKMNLIDSAISFACDAHQYDFALELCELAKRPTDDVHLKMAMDLEDDGKFNEAETEFIRANKPKEAILMYTHCRDWRAASRVAEQHLPSAIDEVLISQAAAAFESRNYQEYEVLMIRAGRTDIVLQHYKEREMWDDALRIAKEYIPSAISEIQQMQLKSTIDSNSGINDSNDSRQLLQEASTHAQNERFRKAINCLLKINKSNADELMVEQAMLRAAEMSNQFLEGNDAVEVADELAPRLMQLNHIGQAVQLYLAAEKPKEAIDVFIRTENWSKARRLAKEIDSQLLTYVEEQQKVKLRTEGNVDHLADIDIMGALDLLAEQGQWSRCIEKAKQHSANALHKYLALYATELIHNKKCVDALELYIQYGAPCLPQNFNIYYRITLECLALHESQGVRIWKDLRNFLFQLIQTMQTNNSDFDLTILDRFENLLLIAHYYATRAICRDVMALKGIAAKISIAVLRYTETIPVDKAFFEAGMDLRTIGREEEAFVILNHYLDICEAIDEGSGNLVDHSDFTVTDFPSSVPIPERMHLNDMLDVHEEIREWILAVSMDQKINQVLPTDERNLFESSLGLNDQPCIISGYPILKKQPITFQRTNRLANRDVWSKITVTAKMTPNTGVTDVIEFVEKWCGHANFISA